MLPSFLSFLSLLSLYLWCLSEPFWARSLLPVGLFTWPGPEVLTTTEHTHHLITPVHTQAHTLSCQEAHFLKSHCWQGILLLQIQYCMCIVCVYILHNTHQHSVPLALGTKSTAHSRIAVPSFCQHTHSHTPFPPASFPVGTWCRWWQIQPGQRACLKKWHLTSYWLTN